MSNTEPKKELLTEEMPENPGDLSDRSLVLKEGKVKGASLTERDLSEDEDGPQLLTEDM